MKERNAEVSHISQESSKVSERGEWNDFYFFGGYS